MKSITKKSITFSIILLFIGVSFSSGISIDTETTSVDDCGCKDSDSLICILFEDIFVDLMEKGDYYYGLAQSYSNNPIIYQIYYSIALAHIIPAGAIELFLSIYCWDLPEP